MVLAVLSLLVEKFKRLPRVTGVQKLHGIRVLLDIRQMKGPEGITMFRNGGLRVKTVGLVGTIVLVGKLLLQIIAVTLEKQSGPQQNQKIPVANSNPSLHQN